MPHTITIDATVAGLKQYQTRIGPKINQKLKQDLEFESMMGFVSCEDVWLEENIAVTGALQPYQFGFTPANGETFSAVENKLQHGKIDLLFTAEQLEKFFSGWRSNWVQLGRSPIEWDFPRYIYTNHILPQFTEDLNLASWIGSYAAPTPGTASTYDKAFDGYKKKIEAAITAGKVTEIATGVPTFGAGDMVNWVEAFCFALPAVYRMKRGKIYMSATLAARYGKDYAAKYPRAAEVVANPDRVITRVDHFNKDVVGCVAMEGSNRIFFYPDVTDNMIIGTREGQSIYPVLRFQEFDRTLKCMAEFSRFYGFRFWDHLFVNDQA
jgi:hypothetical protein